MIDLSKSVVVDASGSVNLESTLRNCAEAIATWNETRVNDLESVGAAVHTVFDTYKGSYVNSKALGTLVLGILKPTSLDAMTVLADRVSDFVKSNSGEGGTFVVRKARGVARVCDLVAESK
jgi:hypothetical protein